MKRLLPRWKGRRPRSHEPESTVPTQAHMLEHTAYLQGDSDGYSRGKREGFDEGYAEGYNDGKEAGIAMAKQAALQAITKGEHPNGQNKQ